MEINGKTKVTGILGYPVVHSLSPAMHNAAFKKLGLNFIYLPFEVYPEELYRAIKGIRALTIAGVNVTLPHKEKVAGFLDELTPEAQSIGAVNTIVNINGKLIGDNTDGQGFLQSLETEGAFKAQGKRVLLIGCGGAGQAIASVLIRSGVRKLHLHDIFMKKAASISSRLGEGEVVSADKLLKLKKIDLLVNATPIGMKSGDGLPVSEFCLKNVSFVYDIIYNRETPLIRAARKAGVKALGGAGMLVYQGALAFERWTGKKAPVDVMKKTLLKEIKKRSRS